MEAPKIANILQTTKLIVLSLILGLGLSFASAWTGPTQAPPGGNTSAPVDLSNTSQVKSGGLGLGSLLTTGGASIGTTISSPQYCIGTSCINTWPSGGTSQWGTAGSAIYYNAGNVGISTTNPGAKLQINSPDESVSPALSIRRDAAPTYGVDFTLDTNSNGLFSLNRITGGNSNNMMAWDTNTGNVGIGTASPYYTLEVQKSGSTAMIGLFQTGQKQFGIYSGSGDVSIYADTSGDTNGRTIHFARHGTTGGTMVTFKNDGNVGIGTASPGYKFTVVGPAADWTAVINPSNTQAYGLLSYGTSYAGYFGGPIYGTGNLTVAGTAYANGYALCQSNGTNCPGSSSYATYLNPISGDSNYKFAYSASGARTNAGEWGRAVMYYVPNGQTYGIRVDRADYADSAGSATNATNASYGRYVYNNGAYSGSGWIEASDLGVRYANSAGSAGANVYRTGDTMSGTLTVNGSPSNWAGIFSGNGPYGIYTANTSGYYDYLAYSSYALYSNGSIYVSGSISGSGIYDSGNRVYSAVNPPPVGVAVYSCPSSCIGVGGGTTLNTNGVCASNQGVNYLCVYAGRLNN